MGKYVLVYTGGGSEDMPAPGTPEFEQIMGAWGAWFETMGDAVLDGGNPFAGATCIGPDGSTSSASSSGATGYSILQADSMDKAVAHAQGCPTLQSGGSVDVLEAMDM